MLLRLILETNVKHRLFLVFVISTTNIRGVFVTKSNVDTQKTNKYTQICKTSN